MQKYDCDVLVVGSGAGGQATAVASAHQRLKVLVVEKEPVFGGTTARSGGWMWVASRSAGFMPCRSAFWALGRRVSFRPWSRLQRRC